MAFSPPAIMIPKRILYGMAIGIAVVGGENAIQRPGVKVGGYARSLHKRSLLLTQFSKTNVLKDQYRQAKTKSKVFSG